MNNEPLAVCEPDLNMKNSLNDSNKLNIFSIYLMNLDTIETKGISSIFFEKNSFKSNIDIFEFVLLNIQY